MAQQARQPAHQEQVGGPVARQLQPPGDHRQGQGEIRLAACRRLAFLHRPRQIDPQVERRPLGEAGVVGEIGHALKRSL